MPDRAAAPAFVDWPDLASRALAGSVVAANDETFAAREHLIRPEAPVFSPTDFGPKGKVYDGWETRRRRQEGFDWAIVRLGVPGIVRGVVVDTAWFTGNYPPQISVEALADDDHPSVEELVDGDWQTIVAKRPAAGDSANHYEVDDPRRWTHVRLSIHPDGGVARLRVHGEPRPDRRFLNGTLDYAALENGGDVVGCSDAFYASARNLVMPGLARSMAEGWENARRRVTGNDWVTVQLAGPARVRHVELDTSYFVGNAPGWFRLQACDAAGTDALEQASWQDLVPRRRCLPDARQRFLVEDARPVTHVRLDVFPDGGVSRLRVWGELVRSS